MSLYYNEQIVKQIVKANGEQVFTATTTATNEMGEVRILVFGATKAQAQYESAITKMDDSLAMYGHSATKVVYTDNPGADKQFLERLLSSLHADVVPVEKYPTLKQFVRPDDVDISVQSTAAGIEAALAKITDDLNIDDETSQLVVGFDAEWNVDLTQQGASRPTAIVQIAYGKWIYIFQVWLISYYDICNLTLKCRLVIFKENFLLLFKHFLQMDRFLRLAGMLLRT
jgi:hypothetical protein